VVVPDELTPLRAARGEAHTVHHVVEPPLDEAQHLFTRTARQARGSHVVARELLREQAIDAAHALLLAQTEAVLAELGARLAVLARRIGAARHRALVGEATLSLQIELVAVATADLANGTEVASHLLSSVTRDAAWAAGSRCAGWASRRGSTSRGTRPVAAPA